MKATLGITAGDPAGIGLEVSLKSISSVLTAARWVLFADRQVFERNIAHFDPAIAWRWIVSLSSVTDETCLFVYDTGGDSQNIEWGQVSAASGRCALRYLEAASAEALAGRLTWIGCTFRFFTRCDGRLIQKLALSGAHRLQRLANVFSRRRG
jgi:4-hydroxythreonine-4-phosphate dehydrogenase